MRFYPGIYAARAADIERIQGELLREAVARAASESPYYRERLPAAGVSPSRVRGLSDLPAIPLTSREEVQRRNRDFQAVPPDRVVEIVATTGTTGEPVHVPMTADDLERLAENERRGFSWLGSAPGHRFHLAVTMDNLFVAGLAYHLGLRKIGAAAIRVGAQPVRRHLDLLRQLRPDGIVAVPSLLLALARQARKDGEDVRSFAPRRAMLIGDAVRGRDLSSNTLGRLLDEEWGGETASTYGLTEASLAFHECGARRGLHSHPDLIAAEVVDDAGAPLPPGEVGELVVTTLQVEGMPLLRYRTGDVTFLVPGTCPCGRGGIRIGPILGRRQHRLKVKGTTLYPKTIEDALLSVEGIDNFIIFALTGEDGTDRIVVKVGTSRNDACFAKSVGDTLFSKARVRPEVRLTTPGDVDALLYEGGRRKPRVFVDSRREPGEGQ